VTNTETLIHLSRAVKECMQSVLAHRRKWKKRYPEIANPEVQLFLKNVASQRNDVIFYNAPAVVFIITDDRMFNDEACAAAAQNMLLAAWSLGIGSCWIGFAHFIDISPDTRRLLGIPEGYHIAACLIFGYPQTVPKPALRNPVSTVIKWIG
jgi:nitroreductase